MNFLDDDIVGIQDDDLHEAMLRQQSVEAIRVFERKCQDLEYFLKGIDRTKLNGYQRPRIDRIVHEANQVASAAVISGSSLWDMRRQIESCRRATEWLLYLRSECTSVLDVEPSMYTAPVISWDPSE